MSVCTIYVVRCRPAPSVKESTKFHSTKSIKTKMLKLNVWQHFATQKNSQFLCAHGAHCLDYILAVYSCRFKYSDRRQQHFLLRLFVHNMFFLFASIVDKTSVCIRFRLVAAIHIYTYTYTPHTHTHDSSVTVSYCSICSVLDYKLKSLHVNA